jgi:hypothetical protein
LVTLIEIIYGHTGQGSSVVNRGEQYVKLKTHWPDFSSDNAILAEIGSVINSLLWLLFVVF